MEDREIAARLALRDEAALGELQEKYGTLLLRVAQNLLGSYEDAEECVNDTFVSAWDCAADSPPEKLRPWLLRILQNKAISLWRRDNAQRRARGMETLLSELGDCLPAAESAESALEEAELTALLERFLSLQSQADRRIFLRRYFLGETLAALAREEGCKPQKLANRLFALRKKLRAFLEKEWFSQ